MQKLQNTRPGFHNSAVILIPHGIERNLIKEISHHMGKQKGPQKFIHLHGKEFTSSQIKVLQAYSNSSRRQALALSRKSEQLHSLKALCMYV